MTRMHILYTITYYLPHVSGLTRCLQPIAEQLASAGHKADIIAAQHEAGLSRQEEVNGVSVSRAPVLMRLGKGLLSPELTVRAWKAARSADIVHLILPQFDAGFVALACRLSGKPVVLTYVCSYHAPGLLGKLSAAVLAVSHTIAGLCASRIIAVSSDYAEQSFFCRLFAKKLSFIPLPVPYYPPAAERSRKPGKSYRIGFVGRISREKNVPLLLDAIPLLRPQLDRPFTVELVGPFDPPTPESTALRRRLSETKGELRVHGKLSEAELDTFYKGIDVLVLPSNDRIEAYGMVQVEAMIRGTPCVTSDRPGMRTPIAVSGFGALFVAGSATDLAAKISQVLKRDITKDPEPEKLHDLFHPDKVVSHISDVYQSILQKPAVASANLP